MIMIAFGDVRNTTYCGCEMFVLFAVCAVCLKHFGALKKKIHNFGLKRSFGKQQVSCSRVCSVSESKQKEIRVVLQLLCCRKTP